MSVKKILSLSLLIASMFAEVSVASDLETIVVTGNRVEQSISSIASNISVIQQGEIGEIEAVHINEAMSRIPGTWISRGNGQEHLTAIRSPVLTGAGGCGAFFMAEDGISLRAPGFCNANQLFGVNSEQAGRIEVIRGPGSALYGANAVHGIINIVTPEVAALPDLGFKLTGGPHDYIGNQFLVANKEADSGLAVYGNLVTDSGYKADSGFDQQKLNLLHQTNDGQWSVKSHLGYTNLNQETAGFIQGFEAYRDEDLKRSNPNPEAFRDSRSYRGYSRVTRQMGVDEYIQITPYFRHHDMTFLQHFLPWKSLEENGHESLGLQGLYYKGWQELAITAGVDFDFTEGWLRETQAEPFSPTIPQGSHYDYEVDAWNISPYLNVDFKLSKSTLVSGGIRFDSTHYDYRNLLSDGSACAPEVNNCRFTRPIDQDVSYNEWSAKIGVVHSLSENHRLYGHIARGFRPPQVTELFRLQAGQTVADLDAEAITAFEFGVRGAVKSVSYDVTGFIMNKKNHIFQDTQRFNISNGETEHDGVELSLRWDINSHWYLSGSATLANHQYSNDINISRSGSIQGNDIDTSPEQIANLRIGWSNQDDLNAELEWNKMGEYFLNPENSAQYDGHDLVNLRAGWQFAENWRLRGRLLNLLDEDYAERADFAFGNYRYFVGEPRSLYLSIEYQH